MAELCPDSWRMDELPPVQGVGLRRLGKKPVTDIQLWLECFAIMAAIITSKYPEKSPHMFAYLRTIVKANQTFDGLAWVSYDSQFRRKAATLRSWDWGVIDSGLYNECFTGRAKAKVLCRHCLADSHVDVQCPLADPQQQQPRASLSHAATQPSRSVEICGLFNQPSGNKCTYTNCRYAHICALCRRGPLHARSQERH